MSHSIVTDAAPGGKFGYLVIPAEPSKIPNLKATIEQTEHTLASLRVWHYQLTGWTAQWHAQAIPSTEFEAVYRPLEQAGLMAWVEPLGLDDLRVALGQNPVLPGWLGVTRYTIKALEQWLDCLKRWASGAYVPPHEVAEVFGGLKRAGLSDWLNKVIG